MVRVCHHVRDGSVFKMLGDCLNSIGWNTAVTSAETVSSGVMGSLVKAAPLNRARHAHQITAATPYISDEVASPCKLLGVSLPSPSVFKSNARRWQTSSHNFYVGLQFLTLNWLFCSSSSQSVWFSWLHNACTEPDKADTLGVCHGPCQQCSVGLCSHPRLHSIIY